MKHIRRALLGLLATMGVLIAAVTPAIAMPVQPPPGPTPADPASPVAAHGAGLEIWQLALIAAAAALVLGVVALARRHVLAPSIGSACTPTTSGRPASSTR